MSNDIISEIKELKAKKAKAETAVTKYTTQLETLNDQRDTLIVKLMSDHGIAPEEVDSYIFDLKEKQDKLLNEAKEKLSKINL